MAKCVIVSATGTAYKRVLPAIEKTLANIEVPAVSGRDGDKLNTLCGQYGIARYYLDYREMLDREKYDFVYIASPPFLHMEQLSYALTKTQNILIEKPLTNDMGELDTLEKLIKGKNVAVFYQLSAQAATDYAKEFLRRDYGRMIDCQMTWDYMMDRSKSNVVWKDSERGVDIILDVGVHVLNCAYRLYGIPSDSFICTNKITSKFKSDYAHIVLKYSDFPVIINLTGNHRSDNDLVIRRERATLRIKNYFGEKSAREAQVTKESDSETVLFNEEDLYANVLTDFLLKDRNHIVSAENDIKMLRAFKKVIAAK